MLPSKIRIGCTTYSIKRFNALNEDDHVGRFYAYKQIIEIEKRLEGDREIQCLWHEILHAIGDSAQLKLGERAVDTIASHIVSLFKDNPKLLKRMEEV